MQVYYRPDTIFVQQFLPIYIIFRLMQYKQNMEFSSNKHNLILGYGIINTKKMMNAAAILHFYWSLCTTSCELCYTLSKLWFVPHQYDLLNLCHHTIQPMENAKIITHPLSRWWRWCPRSPRCEAGRRAAGSAALDAHQDAEEQERIARAARHLRSQLEHGAALELERAPIVREVPVVVRRTNRIVRCSCTGSSCRRNRPRKLRRLFCYHGTCSCLGGNQDK